MIDADSVIVPKTSVRTALPLVRPRLGFLGVGWIGLNRLEAIARSGVAEIAAIADPSPDTAAKASASFPKAAVEGSLENLLDRALELDGLVIATPSALHAEQSIAALGRGIAVFCQKPLGRDARETDMVINAARKANRLLGVDLSYRFMSGVRRIRELIQYGELGEIFAVELVFHNAYGPGKDWFFDRRLSGGGCVIDLGIHLVDLALWSLDFPEVTQVTGRLYAGGMDWRARPDRVEDYASARFDLDTGTTVQLGCSWNLHAGQDAVIRGSFHGTKGGAEFRNVNGSFYEFVAERFRGTTRETLSAGPEEWGGQAAVAWARSLARSPNFDPEIESLADVARVLDRIYAREDAAS